MAITRAAVKHCDGGIICAPALFDDIVERAGAGAWYEAAAQARISPRLSPTSTQHHKQQQAVSAPKIIGNYRVVDKIACSGMGVVYEAAHRVTGHPAAIKQILPAYSSHPMFVERFLREARATAAIDDPSIVRILDYGEADDGPFIVMELLRGETLSARLARVGRLPPEQALVLFRQAARALDLLHAKGITHRDLKPDNLFVVPDPDMQPTGERIKILDFGIARMAEGGVAAHATRGMMGTPRYMSPEQCADAGTVDSRTDVYAMGVILFEMLTGRPPFPGPQNADFLHQHLHTEPPALSSILPELERWNAVLVTAMAKKRDARFATLGAMRQALDDARTRQPAHGDMGFAPTPPDPNRTQPASPRVRAAPGEPAGVHPPVLTQPMPAPPIPAAVEAAPDRPPAAAGSRALWRSGPVVAAVAIVSVGAGIAWLVAGDGTPGPDSPSDARVVPRGPEPAPPRPPVALASVAPMHFAIIPGGELQMSSPEAGDDSPVHRVTLSAFALAVTEVTTGQWHAVMEPDHCDETQRCSEELLPAQKVSWTDAIEFANRLSAREGLRPCYQRSAETVTWTRDCTSYRLPTEAEWEYACRAGGGPDFGSGVDVAKLGDHAWYAASSNDKVRRVGERQENDWDIKDMHGNVTEWVWDWMAPYQQAEASDPAGPSDDQAPPHDKLVPPAKARVMRGGAFTDQPDALRCWARAARAPDAGYFYNGLRMARSQAER